MPAKKVYDDIVRATIMYIMGETRESIEAATGESAGSQHLIAKVLSEHVGEENLKLVRKIFQHTNNCNISPKGVEEGYRTANLAKN